MSERERETALSLVTSCAEEFAAAKAAHDEARKALHEAIEKARDAGVPTSAVARAASLTTERVSQIAPVRKLRRPRVHAQEEARQVSRADVPGTTGQVPTMLAVEQAASGLAGIVSTRKRTPYGRATVFYRDGFGVLADDQRHLWLGWPAHDNKPSEVLALVEQNLADLATVRVYLTGARPVESDGTASLVESVRSWALEAPREGWEVAPAGHYLADPDAPVLRFRHTDTGQSVTILRAAMWWGETDADQATCATAWRGLGRALENAQPFRGAGLADTPATTGRALWQRTIPESGGFPVLSDEYRELIAATAGQGRIELRAPESKRVERFTVMDGRFMYGALCYGLPVGEPRRWTSAEVEKWTAREWQRAIRGRSRWRVSGVVPDGWDHVGMFMVPGAGGGWSYPAEPGEHYETWVDGYELWAAMDQKNGWEPTIHEGFTMDEGRPLDRWSKELMGLWRQTSAHDQPAAALAAKAIRQIVITTIGAFATRAHPVTRTAHVDTPNLVPDGVEVRRVGDALVWEEAGKLSSWSAEVAHPEWSATIWARARTRLLTGAGVSGARVGALHVPREHVIGFATDAIYLADTPDWADDGEAGRFRVKGALSSPAPWPTSYADLYTLRDKAER